MKIKDIIATFTGEEREETEKTVNACMAAICCEKVNWQEFEVFDNSVKTIEKVLKKLAIEFLLPIAERVREEEYIEVLILSGTTDRKTDEIGCVKVTPSQLYATIKLSPKTRKALSEN